MSVGTAPTAHATRVLAAAPDDPMDPLTWSGLPYQVVTALQRLGLELQTVDTTFGPLEPLANLASGLPNIRRIHQVFGNVHPRSIARSGSAGDRYRRLRAIRIARESRKLRSDAALCVSHSALSFPADLPLVLVEDMTVSQVRRLPGFYPQWDTYPDGYIEGRQRQQAEQFKSAQAIGFLSSWVRDAAIADYGVEPERCTVIGVGSRFEPQAERRSWDVPRFLFVGVDWKRKNGDMVVEAFAAVRERYPEAELHLVGGHPEIDAPGVVGHGLLSRADPEQSAELGKLFLTCTCFVLPSGLEPAGMAYAEACSQGMPSIGTVHGGAADIIGDAGVVVDPTDLGAVEASMIELAEPSRAAALGQIARRRAPMLTWDAVAARLASAAGWWDGTPVPLSRVTP